VEPPVPWLDLAYTVFFLPGVILGLFGVFWFAGPMTLVLLPMALVMNFLMFRIEAGMFARQGLRVRRNVSGFLIYAFAYSAILQPACVWGYCPKCSACARRGEPMIWRGLAAPLLLACLCTAAQGQTFGGLGNVAGETDADHFSTLRLRAGGLFGYQSPWQYFGVAAQENSYTQSNWRARATGVLGLWRDQARDTLAGVNAEFGVVEVAGHTRPIGDATWRLLPVSGTAVELLGAGGLVETRSAIEQGIGYTFWVGLRGAAGRRARHRHRPCRLPAVYGRQ
jgi:hypothetical protein